MTITTQVATKSVRQTKGGQAKQKLDLLTKVIMFITISLLLLMIILPLANILVRSSETTGVEVFKRLLSDPVTQKIFQNTVVIGLSVGAVGTLIGFLLAYAQTRLQFRGKKLLHIICLVPLISPPFAWE